MKKIILIIVIVVLCIGILFASGFISFKNTNTTNNTSNNVTNNTSNNTTNTTNPNLTNTSSNANEISTDNSHPVSKSQKGSDSDGIPDDLYSRWDTDNDGIISSGESDVHDRALRQGDYYTGRENMRDSVTTYP